MDSNYSISIGSCYPSERADEGMGLARLGIRRDGEDSGELGQSVEGGPEGGLWHGRVGRGGRSKGRRKRWVRRRKLLLDLCPVRGRAEMRGI